MILHRCPKCRAITNLDDQRCRACETQAEVLAGRSEKPARCTGDHECPAVEHVHGCYADHPRPHEPPNLLGPLSPRNAAWLRAQQDKAAAHRRRQAESLGRAGHRS